eukprot:5404614-Pyramimonas_sp.AAC.1
MSHQGAMGVASSTRLIAEMFNPQTKGDGMAKPFSRCALHEAVVCDLCETNARGPQTNPEQCAKSASRGQRAGDACECATARLLAKLLTT